MVSMRARYTGLMPDERYDIVVIGGGIVGLSTALSIGQMFPRLRVAVLEKEDRVARHQSGHNSGVIHSGIYYKPGSLKAKLCVEGAAALVEFCREYGIKHRLCGKVIVATREDELPRLHELFERATANGLRGVRELVPEEIREIEPYARGIRGLHVPSTGIVDYIAVCERLADLITGQGGAVRTNTEVRGIRRTEVENTIETTQGKISAHFVINCAGLHSDRVSRLAGDKPNAAIVPFRGEYYDLVRDKEYLVKALIYPVPDPRVPFLGVHFTQRIHGGVDAGPNAVLALKREGYRWNQISMRDTAEAFCLPGFWRMAKRYWRHGAGEIYRSLNKAAFVRALQRLVPEIRVADLVADGSGVRAQALRPDGSLVDDFQFESKRNMLHVYNVPSPAATASLSIGRVIAEMAGCEFGLQRG